MAYQFNYEIGATYAGRVNVQSLTTLPNMAPSSLPLAYPESVIMSSGISVGRGFPLTAWRWNFIPDAMFTAFRVICPGASASVYIRTLKEDYSTYAYYTAKMQWPDPSSYEHRNGKYYPFELTFTNMVLYTP